MTDRDIFERIFLKHNPTGSAEHCPFEPERYKYAFAQSNYEMFLEYKAAIIEANRALILIDNEIIRLGINPRAYTFGLTDNDRNHICDQATGAIKSHLARPAKHNVPVGDVFDTEVCPVCNGITQIINAGRMLQKGYSSSCVCNKQG